MGAEMEVEGTVVVVMGVEVREVAAGAEVGMEAAAMVAVGMEVAAWWRWRWRWRRGRRR